MVLVGGTEYWNINTKYFPLCSNPPTATIPGHSSGGLTCHLGSLSLSAVLIMDCLCHKWLDINDKTGNPIKLIFTVLNYARKNKYPRLRSAFTYIDEEQPSRLDFGKHKFGGPFTEEEVEDVKTILSYFTTTSGCICSWTTVLRSY